MTQEEKQILLADLCARLPFKIKGVLSFDKDKEIFTIEGYEIEKESLYLSNSEGCCVDDFKPYLRSLSSMTEEEKKELSKKYVWNIWTGQIQIRYHSQGCWDDETECPTEEYIILFDWLNAHHFDYRGLIKEGLALEAPKDMYNIKN